MLLCVLSDPSTYTGSDEGMSQLEYISGSSEEFLCFVFFPLLGSDCTGLGYLPILNDFSSSLRRYESSCVVVFCLSTPGERRVKRIVFRDCKLHRHPQERNAVTSDGIRQVCSPTFPLLLLTPDLPHWEWPFEPLPTHTFELLCVTVAQILYVSYLVLLTTWNVSTSPSGTLSLVNAFYSHTAAGTEHTVVPQYICVWRRCEPQRTTRTRH